MDIISELASMLASEMSLDDKKKAIDRGFKFMKLAFDGSHEGDQPIIVALDLAEAWNHYLIEEARVADGTKINSELVHEALCELSEGFGKMQRDLTRLAEFRLNKKIADFMKEEHDAEIERERGKGNLNPDLN